MAEADVLPLEATGEEQLPSRAGEKLRAARERLGIGRGEISERTKINERHLAAVEDSDFAALPARIYAVGFARSYAGAVGLDGAAIAAQVRRELNEQSAPANARPAYDLDIEDPAKIPSRRLVWLAAALSVAVIAAGTVFWRSYFVPAVDLPAVRDDFVASTVVSPELSPAAMISPTAESAAGGVFVPLDPAPAGSPAASTVARDTTAARSAARVGAAPPAPANGVQSLPSPLPERLEPVAPQVQPLPAGAPAT